MFNSTRLPEEVRFAQTIVPASYSAGAVNGNAVDTKGYGAAAAVVNVGNLGSSATLDVKIQESADGSTGWTDIANAAITQLADTGGDNAVATIDIDLNPSRLRHLRGVGTVATAACVFGVAIILYRPDGTQVRLPIAQSITPKYA